MAGDKHSDIVLLKILSLLETESLSTREIVQKLEGYDYSDRQINREINTLEVIGFIISMSHRRHSLEYGNLKYRESFLLLLQRLSLDLASLRNRLYGTIDPRAAAGMLSKIKRPAQFFVDLFAAAEHNSIVSFVYDPQTDQTLKSVRIRRLLSMGLKKDRIAVNLILYNIVFSLDYILLMGRAMHGSAAGKIRQYLLKGVNNLIIKQPDSPLPAEYYERVDPKELYQHSLRTWIGGEQYNLEIIEISPDGSREKLLATVNGEDEILSYLASSLGRRKLVNPPDSIVDRARELGYPEMLLFINE